MPAPTNKAQNLSTNNFIIVMLLISFLVIGISALAVKSLYTTIQRDNKVREAKSKADKQLKENVEAAPVLVEAYNSLGDEKVLLGNALPNSVDFPSLIVVLENMANFSGVKLKTVSPLQLSANANSNTSTKTTATSTATAPQVYGFTIALDGTYDAMRKLLEAIESSARPMRVTGMQLTGTGSAMSAQIDVETYYQAKASLPISKETIK